jgi:hypothetical protein
MFPMMADFQARFPCHLRFLWYEYTIRVHHVNTVAICILFGVQNIVISEAFFASFSALRAFRVPWQFRWVFIVVTVL